MPFEMITCASIETIIFCQAMDNAFVDEGNRNKKRLPTEIDSPLLINLNRD